MTIYSLDVLLFLFGSSLSFHVQVCCFLTCIQVSQEGGQVVWYAHLLKNFPQFIVIHTVKGYGIVNKAKVDVLLCNPMDCSPTRPLRPWDFPGKNTGVGCHLLLQEIFLTHGLNSGLLKCRHTIYHSLQPKIEKLYTVSKNKTRSWL